MTDTRLPDADKARAYVEAADTLNEIAHDRPDLPDECPEALAYDAAAHEWRLALDASDAQMGDTAEDDLAQLVIAYADALAASQAEVERGQKKLEVALHVGAESFREAMAAPLAASRRPSLAAFADVEVAEDTPNFVIQEGIADRLAAANARLVAIREMHRVDRWLLTSDKCVECGTPWPCPTIREAGE